MILFLVGALGLSVASSQLLELEEGDKCEALGGGDGTCRLLSQCKTVGDFKTHQPPICDFRDKEPIVCCPIIVTTVPNARCLENSNIENAVDGIDSAPKTHTFMALIGYGETKTWLCGGSLITARYVLSSARCSNFVVIGPAKWVRLGESDQFSTSEDAQPVDKAIIERIPHPKYNPKEYYHDIALFKLDSEVVFNNYILPICLNIERQLATTNATVIGFGRTGLLESIITKVQEAQLEVYNDTKCKRLMFRKISCKTPRSHKPEEQLCAGVPNGGRDAYQGHSGVPLVVWDSGMHTNTQIGIKSFGKIIGHPNQPGVYVRVSNYISWIEEVISGDGPVF